ncbi:hypothetical protein [Chitinimonas naiadis]
MSSTQPTSFTLVELGTVFAGSDQLRLDELLSEAEAGRIDLFVRCPYRLVPISDSDAPVDASMQLLSFVPDPMPPKLRYWGPPKVRQFDFPVRQENAHVLRLYPASVRGVVDQSSLEVMFFNGWLALPSDDQVTDLRSLVLSNSPYSHLQIADRAWNPNHWGQESAYVPLKIRWTDLLIDARHLTGRSETITNTAPVNVKASSPTSPSALVTVLNQLADVYFGNESVEKTPFKAVSPNDKFDLARATRAVREKLAIKVRRDWLEHLCRSINLDRSRSKGVTQEYHGGRVIQLSDEERGKYPQHFSDALIVYNECARLYHAKRIIKNDTEKVSQSIEDWLGNHGVIKLTDDKFSTKGEQAALIGVFLREANADD